jgi:UDP-glucose 4-epimerase
MKNILILGASGFIGKNIIENLVNDNFNIILSGIDLHLLPENIRNDERVKLKPSRLLNINFIKSIIKNDKIDVVIHLVSTLIPSSCYNDFLREFSEVIQPTFQLLNYLSSKQITIIFFSSGGTIYGKAHNKIKENHKLEPINYYGFSKLMIEDYIKLLNRINNLKYIILRPSNVYGKYQRLEAQQGFIAVAIGKILTDMPIEIWGDGKAVRDYIYVQDLAEIVNKIIRSNLINETLNVGSGTGIDLLEIIELLHKHFDKKIELVFKDKRPVDLDEVVLDVGKLESLIDFNLTAIEHGILEFLRHLNCGVK